MNNPYIKETTECFEIRGLTFEVEIAYIPSKESIDPRDYEEGELVSDRVIAVWYDEGYAEFPPDTVKWLAEQHADEIENEIIGLIL